MSEIRRGDIRRYEPVLARPGQSLYRVVVSPDAFNQSASPIVLGLHVVDHDPGGLLAVQTGSGGWALIPSIEGVHKRRLGEIVGRLTAEEREVVDRALKAVLDLD